MRAFDVFLSYVAEFAGRADPHRHFGKGLLELLKVDRDGNLAPFEETNEQGIFFVRFMLAEEICGRRGWFVGLVTDIVLTYTTLKLTLVDANARSEFEIPLEKLPELSNANPPNPEAFHISNGRLMKLKTTPAFRARSDDDQEITAKRLDLPSHS